MPEPVAQSPHFVHNIDQSGVRLTILWIGKSLAAAGKPIDLKIPYQSATVTIGQCLDTPDSPDLIMAPSTKIILLGTFVVVVVMSLLLFTSTASADSVEDVRSCGNRIRLLVGVPPSPVAVVVLFAGGHGALDIQSDGWINWGRGNFLVRSRKLFQEQGYITAVIDAPSDKIASGLYQFRDSDEHAQDIAAVIRHLRARYDRPIWLVGTSRGTESVANAAIRLEVDIPDGIVLTSSMLRNNNKGLNLLSMNLEKITVPTLIVHHKSDECKVTPYDKVASLRERLKSSPKVEVLAYQGGLSVGRVCQAFSYHGYNGIEKTVVKDISQWIKAYSPGTAANHRLPPAQSPHG